MTDASILVGYKQPHNPDGDGGEGGGLPPPSPLDRRPARWWLWLLTLGVFGVIVFLQQAAPDEGPTPEERRALAVGDTVEPPGTSMLVLMGKLLLAVEKHSPTQSGDMMRMIDQQVGLLDANGKPTDDAAEPLPEDADAADADDGEAAEAESGGEEGKGGKGGGIGPPAAERFRAAVLAGEAEGADAAIERLRKLETTISPTSPLHDDIRTALIVYEQGPDAAGQSRIDSLVDRHGWFGKLLASHGRDDTDPFRAGALTSAFWALVFFVLLGLGVLGAAVTGFVLLIVGLVLAATGKMRSATARTVVARRASGVWLETFAVFLLGFLSLKLVGAYVASVASPGATWPIWFQLLGQWSLVLLVLWPLARGMTFAQYCGEVGWHRGRGLLREVGAGIASYLAALPIYIAVAIVVVLLMWFIKQATGAAEEPPVPDNRVFEIFEKGSPAMTALLASLVVMWAPLVEETIFRGALFRAVRPGWGAAGAALLTAAMFALMHQYGLPQLILVGTLGLVFAIMREWRGSLLPSMTAHAVHNGMVMVVVLVVIQLARG